MSPIIYIFFAYDKLPMVGETVYDGIVVASKPEEALLFASQALEQYLEAAPEDHYLKLYPVTMPQSGTGYAEIDYGQVGVYGECQSDGSVKVLQEEFSLS